MTLVEAIQDAPVFTAGIGALALITAVTSILVQRKVARCRAAVDFFVKIEMDEAMIAAFRAFEDGVREFRSFLSMEAFMESQHCRSIQRYLNIHELMAVGVHTKIFDQRVCYAFWSDILAAHHNDTERLIAHIRRQPGGSATYEDLLRLHRRWNGRRWIWQRWRSYRWPFCL
jgi:hypothetical protein